MRFSTSLLLLLFSAVPLVAQPDRPSRAALLRQWVDAGMVLGNHTYSHPRLQDTHPERYQDDIIRGYVVTRTLMEGRQAPLFFRYPYNSTGPTKEIKQFVQDFLQDRGGSLSAGHDSSPLTSRAGTILDSGCTQ